MKKIGVLALLAMVILPAPGEAGEDWTPTAQIRHRFEADDKDFNSAISLRTFSLLRTRLGADFEPAEDVRAFIQVQDSRVFGEETSTLGDGSADQFDLHQGFLVVDDLFGAPLALKLGRSEVIYGPQRLIGAVGWHNVGRSFDGAGLRYHRDKAWVDVFSYTLTERMLAGDAGDAYVHGAWGKWKVTGSHAVQPFWIWQRRSPQETLSRHTLGLYASGKGRAHYEAELAFQTGDITTLSGVIISQEDVSAFMAALNVGLGFPDMAGVPDVSAGVDYLSGDGDADDGKFKVFDTLYATNHKYYGFMDYFLNIPVNTFGLGLVDAHVRLAAKPHKKLVTKLAVHVFRAAESYTLSAGSTSKAFGTEGDVTLKLNYNEKLGFVFGGSFFVPGDVFKETRGPDTSSWFYLMTTVNT